MNLRPHHFLCIQKFTGHGYDEAFTKHMTEVVKHLANGSEVILHKGCDDVCVACPYNQNGKCISSEKVDRLDEGVMRVCGFHYGFEGPWKDMSKVAYDKILNTMEFDNICGDCQWYKLCKETKEASWITQK